MYKHEIEDISTSKALLDKKYNKTGIYVLYPFVLLIIALICFLYFGKKEILVKATGTLENYNFNNSIYSKVDAEISEIFIKDNSKVASGELLLSLDDSNITDVIQTKEKELDILNMELEYIELAYRSIEEQLDFLEDDRFGYKNMYAEYILEVEKIGVANNTVQETLINESSNKAQQIGSLNDQISVKLGQISDYKEFVKVIQGGGGSGINSSLVRAEVNEYYATVDQYSVSSNDSSPTIFTPDAGEDSDNNDDMLEDSPPEIEKEMQSESTDEKETSKVNEILNETADDFSIGIISKESVLAGAVSNELETYRANLIVQVQQKINTLEDAVTALEDSKIGLSDDTVDGTVDTNILIIANLKDKNINALDLRKKEIMEEQNEILDDINELEEELPKYEVRAYDDGIIQLSDDIVEGLTINTDEMLARVVTNSSNDNYVEGYVSSGEIYKLSEDQEIQFRVQDSNNKKSNYTGQIDKIEIEPVKLEVGTYYVIKCSAQDIDELPYGITGDLYIITGRKNYLSYFFEKFMGS